MFGDAFPSHDSDQLPGAQAWTSAPTQTNPTTNDTGITMATLLSNAQMDTLDPISLRGHWGGQRRRSQQYLFRSRRPRRYFNIRGLCPEEPNKYGSYYLPMLAHYAKTTDLRGALGNDTTNMVKQNITTYAVVASAPVPILEFTVGANKVQLSSAFHSGCPAADASAPHMMEPETVHVGWSRGLGTVRLGTATGAIRGQLVCLRGLRQRCRLDGREGGAEQLHLLLRNHVGRCDVWRRFRPRYPLSALCEDGAHHHHRQDQSHIRQFRKWQLGRILYQWSKRGRSHRHHAGGSLANILTGLESIMIFAVEIILPTVLLV